jgi:hypothetical protein
MDASSSLVNRRTFLKQAGIAGVAVGLLSEGSNDALATPVATRVTTSLTEQAATITQPIVDFAVIMGDSANPPLPNGFTLINVALNQGSGSKYIFLCYRRGLSAPITDITFVPGNVAELNVPPGYIEVPQDLNAVAGGRSIYLCFRRGDPRFPILDVAVISGSDIALLPPAGFSRISFDLNQGVGGESIYLCARKDMSNWMAKLAPKIYNTQLNAIMLPGTHDSGTSTLTPSSQIAPDAPSELGWVSKNLPFVPVKSLMYRWSYTQRQTISEQLEAGIRYLDFRVCWDDQNQVTKIVHALYGDLVTNAINQVATFVNTYQQEIVILQFSTNAANIMPAAATAALRASIKAIFGPLLAPNSLGPTVHIGTLWKANQRVIVIFGTDFGGGDLLNDESSADPMIWPSTLLTRIDDLGADGTDNTQGLGNAIQQAVTNVTSSPVPVRKQFFKLACCLTPSSSMILRNTIKGSLLKNCAQPATPMAADALWNPSSSASVLDWNIVSADFVELAPVVDAAIQVNLAH